MKLPSTVRPVFYLAVWLACAGPALLLSSCASSNTFKDEGSYTIGAPPEKERGEIHGSVGAGAAFGSDGYSSQWTGGEVYYTRGNLTVGAAAVQESEL
ncbi:hypothetical protein [Verrucomicrobium sp. BvORR106]|uniref:hypothetical protein n=1 Tax=Verrucomicrobium sp. BvORR106 TaxID=1403819 RepID=UPI00056DEFF2|nr:hypothetical protein [Verrucomicrobium sp. BvORR106]